MLHAESSGGLGMRLIMYHHSNAQLTSDPKKASLATTWHHKHAHNMPQSQCKHWTDKLHVHVAIHQATFEFQTSYYNDNMSLSKIPWQHSSRSLTFPEVAFRLSCHLAHDFRSVDEKEECSRFIGHGPSDERLPSTRWAVEKDTSRWLHSNGTEQLRVTQWKLYHLGGCVYGWERRYQKRDSEQAIFAH